VEALQFDPAALFDIICVIGSSLPPEVMNTSNRPPPAQRRFYSTIVINANESRS